MEKEGPVSTDPIILSMGKDLGRWQLIVCLLIFLVKFPTGWVTLGNLFISAPMNQTCADPPGAKICTDNCTRIEFDRSVFKETIASEFDLTCGNKWKVNFSQTMVMFGILVGSFVFGILSDKYGRKFSFVWACVIQLISGCAASVAPEYWSYCFLRFLVATATGGTMVTSIVIILEIVGKSKREMMSLLYQIPFNLGHASLPAISYFLRDWRWFQLSFSSFSLVYLMYIWVCPESPRWLLINGKIEKATKILTRAAECNKVTTEGISQRLEAAYKHIQESPTLQKASMLDLFKTPNLRRKTIIMVYNWLSICMTYYGVCQYITDMSGDIFINVALGASLGVLGTLSCVPMTKYLGRRITLIISNGLAAIFLLLIGIIPNLSGHVMVGMATVGVVAGANTFANVYLYAGELFPTVVRNSGVGLCSLVGRVGSMTAPFVTDLKVFGFGWPAVVFGLVALLSAILTLFLPETKGFVLPETLEDAEQFGKKQT